MQRIILWLLSVSIALYSVANYTAYSTGSNEGYSSILMESTTMQVLEESNSSVRLPVGTLGKLMVALLVAEKVSSGEATLDTTLVASSGVQGLEGATVWLLQGERMSIRDLLKATLIGNANDSTLVLAEYVAPSEEECVQLMNAKAETLGMHDTHYTDVYGYDDVQQYSTAYDLAILGCEVLKYTFLCEIASTYMDTLRDGATQLVNENYLTRTYDGLTGLKASHLGDGSYSIVVAAERDGASYLAVVLGSSDRDDMLATAKGLLNSGFNAYVTTEPSFTVESMKPLTVKHGVDSAVLVQPKSLHAVTVSKGSNAVESVVFLPEYVTAPVTKGQRVGEVCFYIDDTLIYKTDLVACDTVQRMEFSSAFRKLLYYLLKY